MHDITSPTLRVPGGRGGAGGKERAVAIIIIPTGAGVRLQASAG
jgi:hypothetical protein